MLQQRLFQKALPVLKNIEAAGYEAYFVGGCVRDALLKRPISDVDIATSAFPEEIKQIFPRTVDVGIEHGTVMVLYQQETYEITTFRTESTYQDYRRPDSVTFIRSLEEDLKRRDFTINALALDCRGRLYDFHQGKDDLEKKIVRAVGCATERFHEDALRMMRAVRFAGQLGFQIDKSTQQGIQENAPLLAKIAIERIYVEWVKLLKSPNRQYGLNVFMQTDLYRYCPMLAVYETQLKKFIEKNSVFHDDVSNWVVLLFTLDVTLEQAKQLIKQWKMSNQDSRCILAVLTALQWRQHRPWTVDDLYEIGGYLADKTENIAYELQLIETKEDVQTQYQQLAIHSVQDLALNGREIMQLLKKEIGGKYLGEIIEQLRYLVLHNKLSNQKDSLSEWIVQQIRN